MTEPARSTLRRRPTLRRWAALPLAVASLWAVAACSADDPETVAAPPSTSAPAPSPSEASESPTLTPEGACHFKKAWAGDIYVISTVAGDTNAQALGGSWVWDYSTGECVTSAEFVLRATASGDCTQVGLASKNSNFDPDERPVGELKVVYKERGDC